MWVFFVLLKICLYSATDCQTRVMDLIFIVATPNSVASVFNNIRSFMAAVVQPMNIGRNIRIGLIT